MLVGPDAGDDDDFLLTTLEGVDAGNLDGLDKKRGCCRDSVLIQASLDHYLVLS